MMPILMLAALLTISVISPQDYIMGDTPTEMRENIVQYQNAMSDSDRVFFNKGLATYGPGLPYGRIAGERISTVIERGRRV